LAGFKLYVEIKLKQNSFETVLLQFHFSMQTVLLVGKELGRKERQIKERTPSGLERN